MPLSISPVFTLPHLSLVAHCCRSLSALKPTWISASELGVDELKKHRWTSWLCFPVKGFRQNFYFLVHMQVREQRLDLRASITVLTGELAFYYLDAVRFLKVWIAGGDIIDGSLSLPQELLDTVLFQIARINCKTSVSQLPDVKHKTPTIVSYWVIPESVCHRIHHCEIRAALKKCFPYLEYILAEGKNLIAAN